MEYKWSGYTTGLQAPYDPRPNPSDNRGGFSEEGSRGTDEFQSAPQRFSEEGQRGQEQQQGGFVGREAENYLQTQRQGLSEEGFRGTTEEQTNLLQGNAAGQSNWGTFQPPQQQISTEPFGDKPLTEFLTQKATNEEFRFTSGQDTTTTDFKEPFGNKPFSEEFTSDTTTSDYLKQKLPQPQDSKDKDEDISREIPTFAEYKAEIPEGKAALFDNFPKAKDTFREEGAHTVRHKSGSEKRMESWKSLEGREDSSSFDKAPVIAQGEPDIRKAAKHVPHEPPHSRQHASPTHHRRHHAHQDL
jgi:hypothetical protein